MCRRPWQKDQSRREWVVCRYRMPLDGVRHQEVVLVDYDEDDWWHERLVFGFLGMLALVVCTPHWDLYVEGRADYRSVHRLLADGSLPPSARFGFGAERANRVVRFNRTELARRLAGLLRRAAIAEPGMVTQNPAGESDPPGGAVVAPILPVLPAAAPIPASGAAVAPPAMAVAPALGGGGPNRM